MLDWQSDKKEVKRRLGHILKHTEDGLTVGESAGSSGARKRKRVDEVKSYGKDSLIPTSQANVVIVSPCVIPKRGMKQIKGGVYAPRYVRRYKTPGELLDAYDMQVYVQQAIIGGSNRDDILHAIVQSLAEKVAHKVIKSVKPLATRPDALQAGKRKR